MKYSQHSLAILPLALSLCLGGLAHGPTAPASVVGTETIEDATRQPRKCWHLELKASNDLATYNRVEYWVEQGSFYPIKGKFYSDSGRLLKIVYFRNFAQQLGAVRATEAIIIDAVD